MGRVGLDAALALKTLKKHEPPITHSNVWTTLAATGSQVANRALVIHPFSLDRANGNSETARECDNIYYYNCRGEIEILPEPTNCQTYMIRFIMGYSKGDPNGLSTVALSPLQGAQGTQLSTLLPTEDHTLDPDHYRVITDKLYTHQPSQIYTDHVQPHLDAGVVSTETFVSKANWRTFRKKYNFKFNKKVLFDGPSGSDAVGDIPFVAVLLYQQLHATAYTGPIGTAYPSPHVKLEEKAYFKDC